MLQTLMVKQNSRRPAVYDIYTDGSCRGNRNVAAGNCKTGWGFVVLKDGAVAAELYGPVLCNAKDPLFLGAEHGSNQTAELTAVAEALLWLRDFGSPGAAIIWADSEYAAKLATGQYSAKKNVKLAHKVQDLYKQVVGKRQLEMRHVKGHSGHKWNDVADRLANQGADGRRCTEGRWNPSGTIAMFARRAPDASSAAQQTPGASVTPPRSGLAPVAQVTGSEKLTDTLICLLDTSPKPDVETPPKGSLKRHAAPIVEGGEKMMTFGKHRGRLFRDVVAEDPQYADWALRQPSPGQALSPFLAFVKAWKAGSNSKQ